MLKAHNLEILIQAISAGRNDERHDYLIPSIDAPNIVRDSPSKMTFPVHKALILAGSLQEISMLATQFPAASLDSRNEWHMVRGIIHGHWSNLKSGLDVESIIGVTNIDNAEGAIQAFRDSPGLAMEYERLWFDSGLGDVLTWVLAGIDGNTTLKPVLKRFIENICLSAIRSMAQEREKLDKQDREFAHRAANIRAKLNQGLVAWAELGHNELRDQLGSAFRSKNWKKLVWWKLFWRADDVGYITSDILQRCWLVQAEKAMIWHSGRINQASRVEVTENPQSVPRFTKKLEPPKPKIGDLAPSPLIADIVAELIPQKDIDAAYGELFTGFWPQDISRGRSSLLNTTIPPLQSVCQRLLFQTISTVLLTSSLSSLLYISISTTSIYEAGAIAAFGLIYSMRRLQKEWTLARDDWEANVREEGRKVLRRTEEQMKASLSEDFISSPDATSEEHKILAKSAIERVREDLDRLTNQVNNDDRDGVPEDLRAVKDEAG